MTSSSGHTFLIDGALWYTPNTERTIRLPPPLELGKGVNPFSFETTWESFHQPRRWTQPFSYLCFTPLTRSVLNNPLLHQLVHLPQLEFREGLWSLPDDVAKSWEYLNNAIYEVSMCYNHPYLFPFRTYLRLTRTSDLLALRPHRTYPILLSLWTSVLLVHPRVSELHTYRITYSMTRP
ncbi:hypothetical protein BKA70DRAFT_1441421 [Coprinopsis sp. MPI-PUGE-AT-0042]|nr:hypothetical protein BKA70DRAFT_1441421 [Coprinopsis sp. MPI-PUGE-AT-0042]